MQEAPATITPAAPPAPVRPHVPGWHLHRRLYDWTLSFAHKPGSSLALFIFSFAEASFFPIPPDVLMIPLSLERRERTWWYATVATAGSVIGGLSGYGIGMLVNKVEIIAKCVEWLFGKNGIQSAQKYFNNFGLLTVATIVVHPYKLLNIAAGALGTSILTFILASIIGRTIRFFFVAGLLWFIGPPVKIFLEKYFHILSIVLTLLIVGTIFAAKLLGR